MKKLLIKKPHWIEEFEERAAGNIPFHPNIISGIKLLIITPLLFFALKQFDILPRSTFISVALFLLFGLFDYLDGLVARYRKIETTFGLIFDRITDYPILVVVTYFSFNILPPGLLILKLVLDFILILLYIMGKGGSENRVRTGISFTTLFALFIFSQGILSKFITSELVIFLLWLNIALSLIIILYNLNILQKRFIADALSASNLLCGIFSMKFASIHRIDISLLFLMLGAAFDGFDGSAARKFGSTRWGVYSDDIADAVNYGIAPGVAIYYALDGISGYMIGIMYSVFTIGRLIYFTLSKNDNDPNFFCGVPSTVGALMTICSLILFDDRPAIIGFMVGIACIQMVSFDTHYRHLGRAIASNRRIIYGMPIMVIILITGNLFWGKETPVAIILGVSLLYGFFPTIMHFKTTVSNKLQ